MNKIYNSSKLLLYLWSVLLLSLLTLSSILYRTILLMDGSEFAYIHRNSFVFIGLFILTVIIFFILLRFIIRLPSKVIFLLGTIFYLVLGIYLIMHQNDCDMMHWRCINQLKTSINLTIVL